MPYLNRYSFIGNLTKAPELRFQPNGEKQALCLLNVAINRDSRDESGEKKTQTTFVNDIEVWGPSGEACVHFLTVGSLVLVEGRMDVDQWQDKLSGAKRSRMKVVAENVQFLRIRKPEDDGNPDSSLPPALEPSPEHSGRGPARRTPRAARAET
ncbi:MAG TPA: single-stranded DNA-binding protein [Opitutaceae bacterium]|nr:single-stranded DNA-binding protein [Opitutaceae bacterium]